MMNDEPVRSLEELRKNFDIEKVIEYFNDGKLVKWLKQRRYEDEAEKIAALEEADPSKLCEILGAEYDKSQMEKLDPEEIAYRQERYNKLEQYTSDENLLAKVNTAAFDQEELGDLLDKGAEEILLVNGKYRIPLKEHNKKYIGIGQVIAVIKSNEKINFAECGIEFENIEFDDAYKSIVDNKEIGTKNIEKSANTARVLDYDGRKIEFNEPKKKIDNTNIEKTATSVRVSDYGDRKIEFNEHTPFDILLKYAKEGNAEAQWHLSHYYIFYTEDEKMGLYWAEQSAKNNNPSGLYTLGNCYEYGYGTDVDVQKAAEAYMASADLGDDDAKFALYLFYYNGTFFKKDREKAFNILKELVKNKYQKAYIEYALELYNYPRHKDLAAAQYWFKKAYDDTNDTLAAFFLGIYCCEDVYDKREKFVQDEAGALKWMHIAADDENNPIAEACEWLADYYSREEGFSFKNAAKGAAAGAVAGMGIFSIAGAIGGGLIGGIAGTSKRDEEKSRYYEQRAMGIRRGKM